MIQTISVIIPTCNRPGYLVHAVLSVLRQTHPVHEIIIVDDGSMLKHRPRIASIKELDDCIRIFHFPENKGVSAARNYGLNKSTGEYILFLDDDDLLRPRMLESNLGILKKFVDIDVVSAGYDMFYDSSPPDSIWDCSQHLSIFPQAILFSWHYGDSSFLEEHPFSALLCKGLQVSSCLARRKSIGTVRFPEDLTRGEDQFFLLTLAAAGCRFKINHQQQLAFYRIHPHNSLSVCGWQQEAVNSKLKLLHNKDLAAAAKDRLIVHVNLARLLLRLNLQQSCKHILIAVKILLTAPLVTTWPLFLKFMLDRCQGKWRHRRVARLFKAISQESAHGEQP